MMACYAYEDRKNIDKEIYIGEGLVGRSIRDHETLYLDKLPENYITIRSGLGQSNPDTLIIVPLVTGDEVYGAIEIASLGDFQKIEREFLENLSEDIAVTLKTTKVNMRTNQLLQQSNEQYEELSSQKEEMQQNMEELKATQEESDRRKAEMENLINSLKRSHFFIQYDTDGNIQDINDKYLKLLGKKSDDVVGMHHSELKINTQKKGKKSKTFWKELLNGKTQKDTLEIQKNNKTHTLSCVYTPIIDQKGNTEKVLQIAVDITEHFS
jgi:methyl-accepting chemotaxis protein